MAVQAYSQLLLVMIQKDGSYKKTAHDVLVNPAFKVGSYEQNSKSTICILGIFVCSKKRMVLRPTTPNII